MRTILLLFRFEQEIAEHPISRPVIATNTFHMASKAIENAPKPLLSQEHPSNHFTPRPQAVQPRPLLQPTNLTPQNMRHPLVQGSLNQVPPSMQIPAQHPMHVPPNQLAPPPMPPTMNLPHGVPPMVPQMVPNQALQMAPVMGPRGVPMVPVPMPVALPMIPVAGTVPMSMPIMTAEEQREWESTYSQAGAAAAEGKEKKKREKKFVRVAGDTVWEDSSLADWDQGNKCKFMFWSSFNKLFSVFYGHASFLQ